MNTNISNIKTLVIVGLLVLIIILRGCNRHAVINGGGDVEVVTVTDTTHVYKQHIDTIPFVDTVKRYVDIDITEPEIVPETGLKEYSNAFEDSLVIGEVYSKVDGTLVEQHFKYTPKFPKYIIKTDSIFTTIENTTTIIKNKRELYLGFELGGSQTSFNVSPMISLRDKKNNLYSFRYGVLDQTFNIGLQKQIKFK